MANSQFPGFVDIVYHSPYGVHHMEICHHGWDFSGGSPVSGNFNTWNDTQIEADLMINNLVDEMLPFWTGVVVLDQYTIYTLADPDAPPVPVYAAALGNAGTSIETEWLKAVQTTFSFRTTNFGVAKLVLLDTPSASGFDKILSFAASAEALAIFAELSSLDNGWQARDQGRINVLSQITFTLNEKLRREYNMT